MIGRQVSFAFDEVDGESFLKEVQSTLDGVLLEWRSATEVPIPILEYGRFFGPPFFCLRSDLSRVKARQVSAQGYWTLSELDSPLVSWLFFPTDGQAISEGRLFYTPGMYVGDVWVEKDASFLEFARKVFALVKRCAPLVSVGGRRVRMGKHTAEMVFSGRLRFMG